MKKKEIGALLLERKPFYAKDSINSIGNWFGFVYTKYCLIQVFNFQMEIWMAYHFLVNSNEEPFKLWFRYQITLNGAFNNNVNAYWSWRYFGTVLEMEIFRFCLNEKKGVHLKSKECRTLNHLIRCKCGTCGMWSNFIAATLKQWKCIIGVSSMLFLSFVVLFSSQFPL